MKNFPQKPGVYIIRSEGKVIYVGKSASIQDRVRSYFNSGKAESVKTKNLRDEADEVDYIVTDSEVEALILEENLIKEYRPKYNVLLKDNKRYPYIKITDEKFPQLDVSRKRGDGSGELFGPYIDSGAMRKTLDTIEKIFPVRDCSWKPEDGYRRPCLRHHIDLCPAPCAGKADRDTYMESIEKIRDLLKGKIGEIADQLKEKMEISSENKDFEKAAEWRDKLEALKKITRDQNVRLSDELDRDFIALSIEEKSGVDSGARGTIQVFFVRAGRITGQDSFDLEFPSEEEPPAILSGFIKKFYSNRRVIPAEIYVEEKPEDLSVIEKWLEESRAGKVEIKVPERGQKKKILDMTSRNARYGMGKALGVGTDRKKSATDRGVEEIQEVLGLPTPPHRIEGYDVSNISGTDSVGSMVVFEGGRSTNRKYRRFRIQEKGPDDYLMLQEVLRRRFRHGLDAGDEENEGEADESFSKFPDLILIDGGKGQLNASTKVLESLSMDNIPVIGLAKEYEEVYRPGNTAPVGLSRDSEGLKLLQRIRDEAHRFAVDYHRRLRQKRTVRSSLDSIKGVGPKRKKALLSTFNSVNRVRNASLEELKSISEIPDKVAERVAEFFSEEPGNSPN
ncbi:MAG: excinuclease ABC subunit UvrC [Candidatus Bipolaricaulota bacterium]|nr:excinuclease ABC subunit UvrC [Candidatus Bipolaricaulota bacterium]MBS3791058.1 excinuclease ABC subunit UvrC [Candidatus Bipolaricaulota bacterium]